MAKKVLSIEIEQQVNKAVVLIPEEEPSCVQCLFL